MTRMTLGPVWALVGISVAATSAWTAPAHAQAPALRATVDQNGDFAMIGNSLAHDCGNIGTAPTVGTIGACGLNTIDTAPDVFWQSDDQNNTAAANSAFFPLDARSTAVLNLPAGSTVTHAYLYWAGEVPGNQANQTVTVDNMVTLDRPDGAGATVFSSDITADDTFSRAVLTNSDINNPYDFYQQAVADVTSVVAMYGEGAYRLSNFDLHDIFGEAQEVSFAGWTLVVFYENASQPQRNLSLFDGFTYVDDTAGSATASLSGFLVPNSGFDAKLGVIAYEGDEFFTGDRLLFGQGTLDFNTDALNNGLNPTDNFFNSTRTLLGAADSNSGDLPQLAGTADTMAGLDFDVVDVTGRMTAGQTSADIEATTTEDVYFLGAFVTSISTIEPNMSTSTKEVSDVDGAPLVVGDELEYTITVVNSGNDPSVNSVMTDTIPAGVTYVPGSLEIVSGVNAGALTDAIGDDVGQFDNGVVTVYLGTAASSSAGGIVAIDAVTEIKFRVTVDSAMGTISNQAEIGFSGQSGLPATVVLTDSDPVDPGSQSTDIDVDECEEDIDCGGANNGQVCDATDYTCVPGCRGTGMESGCPMGQMCTSNDDTIGDCVPDNSGAGGSTGSMGTSAGGSGMTGTMSAGVGGGMSGTMSSGVGGAMAGPSSGAGANSANDDGGDIDETGSCGCDVPGNSNDGPLRGLGLVSLLALGMLRRRRS